MIIFSPPDPYCLSSTHDNSCHIQKGCLDTSVRIFFSLLLHLFFVEMFEVIKLIEIFFGTQTESESPSETSGEEDDSQKVKKKRHKKRKKGGKNNPWDSSDSSKVSSSESEEVEEEDDVLKFDDNDDDEFACEDLEPDTEPVVLKRARTVRKGIFFCRRTFYIF